MTSLMFSLEFGVRDYECDMEGIVNNAVYLNYLEHARHEFLKHRGLDFATLIKQGVHLVVIRAEVDYLYPLRSGDQFVVHTSSERISKLRFGFHQTITRIPDNKACLRAKIVGTALDARGKPHLPLEIAELLEGRGQAHQ